MEWSRRRGRIAAAAALGTIAVLALARLSAFGIWDPWELASADLARQIMAGDGAALTRPPLTPWLVSRGFALFGIHEWSGRLPMALSGLLGVGLAYALVARFAGRRAGIWAAVVAGTSPLFLLNAREMLGAAPESTASAGVFLCGMSLVFLPSAGSSDPRRRKLFTAAWAVGLLASSAVAVLASGALVGLAPPLLAIAIAAVARGELTPPRPLWPRDLGRSSAATPSSSPDLGFPDVPRAITAAAMVLLALIVAGGAGWAVWADYADFGYWTGGVPRGGDPPTWEIAIERLFHSFAPWSALLPLALAGMLRGAPRAPGAPATHRLATFRPVATVRYPEENALRLGLVAWVALGFLVETLYTARFGPTTFVPLFGAAAAVALMLRDVERSDRGWWGAALIGLLFVGLILRDYRGYPTGPIAGLPVEGVEVPEIFNPARTWAVLLGLFGLCLAAGLAVHPSDPFVALRRDFRAIGDAWRKRSPGALALSVVALGIPFREAAAQWKRGVAFKLWIVLLATLALALVGFSLACWIGPDALVAELGLTSLGVRVGRALALVLPGLVLIFLLTRQALFLFSKLGSYRLVPTLVVGLAIGGYVSFGFQPELSSHFSPREVYDTYNRLAQPGEPLGEYRVGGRAAAYYATGEIQELASQGALIEFLGQEQRVWAAFRADDLAAIDREYRRSAGRHLFVADGRSARMILATNRPVSGVPNGNYLAEWVLDEPPARIQHPTDISFDERIELIGYDLETVHPGYAGPGEAFTVTWYFRVVAPVTGSFQLFVHVDGPGQRINGDHEPVDGRYPVRLWETGDIVVDRQELRVPGNYRRGTLILYIGFFSGEQRLEVVRGPEDDADRARAGTLPVR